jgi:hypothetical protein
MRKPSEYRIRAINQWGRIFEALGSSAPWPGYESGVTAEEFEELNQIIQTHVHHNGWFTENNVRRALFAWSGELQHFRLEEWLNRYEWSNEGGPRKVGVICAGNLPLVGLHDVLSVLLTGHIAFIKLSSDDNLLMPALLNVLFRLDESIEEQVVFAEGLMKDMQAVIATGSNNTSRYFEQYFGHLPHIIRKSRTSVAILSGEETDEELKALGRDIFAYFGLGCRNVSKIYLPEGFDIDRLYRALYEYNAVINHHKYANNYDYNKAVFLMSNFKLLDNGFLTIKEDTSHASPISSVFYEYYTSIDQLKNRLDTEKDQLQCIVSSIEIPGAIPFGTTQKPGLSDYADQIDTIQFLVGI